MIETRVAQGHFSGRRVARSVCISSVIGPAPVSSCVGPTRVMIDYCPAILVVVTASVWFCTALQSGRLIGAFWARLPQIAAQELDTVVGRSIRNAIFPFRHRAAEVLRGDAVLWRLRQRFLLWAALSVAFPVIGFLGLGAVALLASSR